MVRSELKITMNDDSFAEVKTVQEAWEAMNNYRSAWNRLWPWDWTPVSVVSGFVIKVMTNLFVGGHVPRDGGVPVGHPHPEAGEWTHPEVADHRRVVQESLDPQCC